MTGITPTDQEEDNINRSLSITILHEKTPKQNFCSGIFLSINMKQDKARFRGSVESVHRSCTG